MITINIRRIEKARELYAAQSNRKYYQQLESSLSEELQGLCRGKDFVGGGFAFSRIERKGNVDYGMIPELKTIDLEKYRKENIEYWKLSKV